MLSRIDKLAKGAKMLAIFKKKEVSTYLFECMMEIAEKFGNDPYVQISECKMMLEIEYFIYLFSLTSYSLKTKGLNEIEIDTLSEVYIDFTQESDRYRKARISRTKVLQRISKYMEIFIKLNIDPKRAYELLTTFQSQQICSIISFSQYSDYDPLPSSPGKYGKMINDPLLVMAAQKRLSSMLSLVEKYLKKLKKVDKIWD